MGSYGKVYGHVYGQSTGGAAAGGFRWSGAAAGVNAARNNSVFGGAYSWSGRAVGSAVSLDAARYIEATMRSVSYACTIGGQPYPVKSFDTDAQLKDIPAAVSQLGGVASGQVKFTLPHIVAADVSPFQGIAPTTPLLATGTPVTLSVSFWPGQPGVGQAVYTRRIFTGYLLDYQMDALSDVQVVALDPSFKCAGQFTLPMAAVDPTTKAASTDPGYSSLAPTEAALRASGIYLTAAPSSTDPVVRGKYLMVAMSGYGGNMPEVGQLVSSGTVLSRGAGKFGPDVWRASRTIVRAEHVTRQPLGAMWMDGWVTVPAGAVDVGPVVTAFNLNSLGYPGVELYYSPGVAQFTVSGWGGVHFVTVPAVLTDGQPHYWRGSYQLVGSTITITVQVDSTISTQTQPATVDDLKLWDDLQGDDTVVYRSGRVAVEAFEMWGVPVGDPAQPGQDRSSWAPETASQVSRTSTRLDVILGQEGLDCWGTIQQIAAAEGALAWFDTEGTFHRDSLGTFNARKTAPVTFSYGPDRIDNLPVAVSADSARRQVSAQIQTWMVGQSTAAMPIWAADTTLTVNPRGTSLLRVAADVRGLNVAPLVSSVGPTSGPSDGQSHYQVVDVAQVGDPGAVVVQNVTVTVVPTNTGFDFTVNNPNPFVVAFWSPTTQGPYLQLQGVRISLGAAQTVTADGNPTAKDDLQLDDNLWRVDAAAVRRLVRSVAAGTYSPIPELSNITVPGDPRRFLGELVDVQAPGIMPRPERCLIVSLAMTGETGGRFKMSMGLRPIGPPAGWLAGVPGRSEAGVSSYAPNR